MDDNFGAGVVVEFNEHAVIPNVKPMQNYDHK